MARGEHKRKLAAENPHRVYWGSHGCKKHRKHTGVCVCSCGEVLTKEWSHYGEDFTTANYA